MPYMKPPEFLATTRAGNLLSAYIFAGDESYLVEEAMDTLDKAVDAGSLNREVFFGNETPAAEIMLAAQTLPFLSQKRMIIVKDAHRMKAAEAAKLAEFIKAPADSYCLVLLWQEKLRREDKSAALFSAVDKHGAIVEFRTLYDRELPAWVMQRIKSHGKKISPEAVQYLISESGAGLLDLENEIEKLVLFCGKAEAITLKDVESSSGHTRLVNLNQLSEALEGKKTGNALAVVEQLLNEGEVPLRILATMHRTIRRLLTARCMMDEEKYSADDIKKELRLHPYFDRSFFSHLARYSTADLKKAMQALLAADIELKSSAKPERYVFEEFIFSLAGMK
ncbi:MAG: DNA polymerase III subunit delta [Elusimicrobia bacterium RIFOXYB2_FULL_50_12]|nr:MAG: DNA polymerase III subunit delta [Elusimicrobia bacterium RIFOXYB2_FULL_50_12]